MQGARWGFVWLVAGCGWVSSAEVDAVRDGDGDGLYPAAFEDRPQRVDCDDGDPAVGRPTEWFRDVDGDGVGDSDRRQSACRQPDGSVALEGDCDDLDPDAAPGLPEVCDGADNDCDGATDDGLTFVAYHLDDDRDGWGTGAALSACSDPGPGWATRAGDCDDGDATRFPDAPERCDGQINPCGGSLWADEVDVDRDQYVACDASGQVWRGGLPLLGAGPDALDCAPDDPVSFPGATERCDGVDNDCDDAADDGLTFTDWYVDADRDGYGVGVASSLCANPGPGFTAFDGDCDDAEGLVRPLAPETCDGVDTDCVDGPRPDELDGDGDHYVTCERGSLAWLGDPDVRAGVDCDDDEPLASPDGVEVCDGIDNDCERGPDDTLRFDVYYVDADGDQHGDPASDGVSACAPIEGRVASFDDCDDAAADIHPGAEEVCFTLTGEVDPEDSDCDRDLFDDEAIDALFYYRDRDADAYGDPGDAVTRCALVPPPGYVRPRGDPRDPDYDPSVEDCNDDPDGDGPSQSPGRAEVCDALDNDCDGVDDDNPIPSFVGEQLYYLDADGDQWGSPDLRSCGPLDGFEDRAGDCRDDLEEVNPDATEVPDGVDNDCDGNIDGSGLGGGAAIGGSAAAGAFGAAISKARDGWVLVSAPDAFSGAGAVYLLEPPLVPEGAPPHVVADLAVTTFRGRAGSRLTVIGDNGLDLTNDGHEDYVLFEAAGNGTVLVVPGPQPAGVVDVFAAGALQIPGTAAHPILRAEPVPSVTADPFPDLVVSSRSNPRTGGSDVCDGFQFEGSISLFDGPFTADRAFDGRFASLTGGPGASGHVGLHALGGAGDLSGDGVPDLAFGAPWGDFSGQVSACGVAGLVVVVKGPVAAGTIPVDVHVSGRSGSENSGGYGTQAGWAVSVRHDLDGDGRADLVVGAPYNSASHPGNNQTGASSVGRVYLVPATTLYDAAGARRAAAIGLPGSVTYADTTGRQYFGQALDLEDVNGDGSVDLLVQRPGTHGAYLFRGPLLAAGPRTLPDALRFWTHTAALGRAVLVTDPLGTRGDVLLGVSSSDGGTGAAFVFAGEDIFGP